MKIRKLGIGDIDKIVALYDDIKSNTVNFWDDDYPSRELICWDIERDGLWGVFDANNLVAICFAGERCEDGEQNYTWQRNFNRRGTFARLGVASTHQRKGIATKLVNFVLNDLKKQGFDGCRILVETENHGAIGLYSKLGFTNCGQVDKFGHTYFLFERGL